MKFNGFDIYPCGNAVLSINNNILTVSGISDSGLDGVLIKVQNTDNYVVNFGSLQNIAQNNGVLKCTSLTKNAYGQVTPLFETFKWYNQQSDKVIIGFNSNFLPANYNFFGKLNGVSVFDINNSELIVSSDPNFPSPSECPVAVWGVLVAAAGVVATVFGILYTSTTTTTTYHYDANNRLTGKTVTVTEDPIPFEIEVNGNTYTITEYGIKFNEELPSDLIGYPSIESHSIGEQITGVNLSSFEITSIQAI